MAQPWKWQSVLWWSASFCCSLSSRQEGSSALQLLSPPADALPNRLMHGVQVSQTYTIENDRLVLIEKTKGEGADSRIERYVEGDKLYIVSI